MLKKDKINQILLSLLIFIMSVYVVYSYNVRLTTERQIDEHLRQIKEEQKKGSEDLKQIKEELQKRNKDLKQIRENQK